MKRFIFDLDGTLLTSDYSQEFEYFKNIYGDKSKNLIAGLATYLNSYEKTYSKYEVDRLCRYLNAVTGLEFTPEIIAVWNDLLGNNPFVLEDGIIDLLEYLKSQGHSLVVLTNWFGDSQTKRLENSGLLTYFDAVYGGDIFTKPHKQAYWVATAGYDPKECVFIGDNVDNDYIGPRACAMNSILYDKNDLHHKTLVKVRRLDELKKKF